MAHAGVQWQQGDAVNLSHSLSAWLGRCSAHLFQCMVVAYCRVSFVINSSLSLVPSGGPQGGYHGHYHDESYGPPPPPHYEGRRMGPPMGGPRRGGHNQRYGGPQYGHPPPPPPPGEYSPHADSPVVMVYGLEPSKMNADRVFNVFCLYGNVERVGWFGLFACLSCQRETSLLGLLSVKPG